MAPRRVATALAPAFASVLLTVLPAFGQTNPEAEATRRLLINQAQAAQAQGDHARALDDAQRAAQVRSSPTLLTFIAQEQAALGQLAPALASAQRCVADATADPAVPERATTLATCGALTRELEQRVGRVVIQAPEPAPEGLRVTVAGELLPPALLGVSYVVTPGTVVVDAAAPGRSPFHLEVSVGTGASVPVALALPVRALLVACIEGRATGRDTAGHCCWPGQTWSSEANQCAGAPACPAGRRAQGNDCVAAGSVGAGGGGLQRALGWLGLGVGVLALGGGVVAAVLGNGAMGDFNRDPSDCTQTRGFVLHGGPACQTDLDQGNSLRTVAAGSFLAGGVLSAAGLVLVLTAPTRAHAEHDPASAWVCGAGPGTFGVACGGRF